MTFGMDTPMDPYIADILEDLAEVYDEPEPPRPSASALAAQRKREDAERQRRRRAEMRHHGVPDGRAVDAAVAAALTEALARIDARGHIVQTGGLDGLYVPVKTVLAIAKCALVEKGVEKRIAGRALQERLLASG